MKRFFDLLTSFLGLVLLLPIFAIISLWILIDDNLPILFRQSRVGKSGRLFTLYKFRTMRTAKSEFNTGFEPGNLSRITKSGKFLRKTKLDELPQLINVLLGNMSLVGPRPEVAKWVEVYPERWERVLSVKPGITDNSSVEFRNEESLLAQSEDPEKTYRDIILPTKLDLYEEYVEQHTFFGDIKLIFKTIYFLVF